MNQQTGMIAGFEAALPAVRAWIERTLDEHKGQSVPVADLGYRRLPLYFPAGLLNAAHVIEVPEVPFPPLGRLGLPELSGMEDGRLDGITYIDSFFVNERRQSESLCFHELIHVIQWDRLGIDRFLLSYGMGLLQQGYRNMPLETTAYSLQEKFDAGIAVDDLVDLVRSAADDVWRQTAPLFGKALGSGS